MKKIVSLLIALLIVSCSNDSDNAVPANKNTTLSTITKNYYLNGSLNLKSSKIYFINEKVSVIRFLDGTYDDYKYNSDNLVSSILKYNSANTLLFTTNYSYDNLKRITKIEEIPTTSYSGTQQVKIRNFAYYQNKIVFIREFPSQEFYSYTYELLLDNNNKIIKNNWIGYNDVVFSNILSSYEYIYTNGNLISANVDDEISYNDLKNDYSYKKTLFGKEWKQNSFLANLYPDIEKSVTSYNSYYYWITEIEISENLISAYKKKYLEQFNFNMTASYEFNDKKQILKEIKNYKVTTGNDMMDSVKLEIIYDYQ